MVTNIHTNTSALDAFSKQVQTSANNVANALTDDFKASRTRNVEGTPNGVDTVTQKTSTPGPKIIDPTQTDNGTKELSNTDIAEEMTHQINAQNGFDANAKVIKSQDEMVGTILDIVA
ncbi:MAG: flagellar basal body protein [Desulfobacterales bacterium]|nr:flagellar basal body protein [Desulfobacterales bacterium]